MYTGPPLAENIFDILLRFRASRIALTGDVEKAFLIVGIAEEDRDVLRFLWVDDIEKKNPEIIVLRFTRAVFQVCSSPFILNATLKHHIERYKNEDPEFVDQFLRSIYVDDLSSGATIVLTTIQHMNCTLNANSDLLREDLTSGSYMTY